MRSSVLSDDKVIQVVNEFCTPLAINVTRDGFPVKDIPALKHVEGVYQTNWRFAFGFAGCAIIDSEGQFPLGHSSAASLNSDLVNDYFSNKSFLTFIVESLERAENVKL